MAIPTSGTPQFRGGSHNWTLVERGFVTRCASSRQLRMLHAQRLDVYR